MKQGLRWITLFGSFAAQCAHADTVAANRCAATLQPHARLVFDAVAARPHPEVSLRSLIEARVRELIFSDRLMMNAARPAAEEASQCLRISRNCNADNC
jgi:hypothetical protein